MSEGCWLLTGWSAPDKPRVRWCDEFVDGWRVSRPHGRVHYLLWSGGFLLAQIIQEDGEKIRYQAWLPRWIGEDSGGGTAETVPDAIAAVEAVLA